MKKVLSLILVIMITLAMLSMTVFADDELCQHEFIAMRNMVSHYEECQKCFELLNAGNHTFANGKCTVCGCEETVVGEGEHDHKLMNGADMDYHFEECQVCFERFDVKDHTFKDDKCTVCGYDKFANPFIDVSESAWYYGDVIRAFYDGLINGKTGITFAPDLNITYVEAIKLAACMHQKYTEGAVTLTVGNPWYEPYVKYCIDNGIIREEHGYDLNAPATRQGYMRIFAYSLPQEALEEINYVAPNSIPDVQNDPAIYKLYRAGIVGGVDAARNCNPDASIKRSEVAAVLTRMMYKSARIEFTLGEKPVETEPLRFTGASSYSYYGQYVFSVTAEGGKAPHTYTWYCKDGDKESALEHGAFAILETENISKDSGIIAFPFKKDNPYLGKQLKLVVTDADGESIDTGYTDIPAYFEVEAPEEVPEASELCIVQQPEVIETAELGELLYYDVIVEGGKEPYTYTWQYNSQTRYYTDLASGDKVVVNGNTLGIRFDVETHLAGRRIRCVITDASGASVITDDFKIPEMPFTFELEDVVKNSLGTVFVGSVKTGRLVPGDFIAVCFDDKYTYGAGEVSAIEMFGKSMDEALPNDRVGILIKDFGTNTTRESVIKNYDTDNLIGERKNLAIKMPLKVSVSYTPRGNVGGWTEMGVHAYGGKAPYTYEWQFAFSFVSFAAFDNEDWAKDTNTDTLKFKVKEDEFVYAYAYRCAVMDAAGNVAYSEAKTVTPFTLVIGEHPSSVYANYGDEVEFEVKAYGARDSALTYKWQYIYDGAKTFKDILPTDSWASGYNTDTLKIYVEKTEFVSHVYYRCVVTDGEGNEAVTNAATVLPEKPFILKHPGEVAAKPDTYIKFSVEADGRYKPLSYKWYYYFDGIDGFLAVSEDHEWADGETTNTLTVGVDRKNFNSSFKCYCVITDANGNEVKSLEGSVLLSDDAGVDLETGHAPKDYPIVLIW